MKVFGARSVNVKVVPRGPIWRRHIEQLRPRYGSEEDGDPGEVTILSSHDDIGVTSPTGTTFQNVATQVSPQIPAKSRIPENSEYGPNTPRRSIRNRKPVIHYQA